MKNIQNRNRVGFRPTWMEKEETQNPIALESMTNISTENPTEGGLTAAHAELKARIAITEQIISGKTFSKFIAEKKKEFLDEYKWLISLDAQLGA